MKRELFARLAPFGQAHLLDHWDTLDAHSQQTLAVRINSLDLNEINQWWLEASGMASGESANVPPDNIDPPQAVRLATEGASDTRLKAQSIEAGESLLSRGKVAVVLVAGGQGTRLGRAQPKGTLPIGPLSGRSLFEMHIGWLEAIRRRFGHCPPLYVMTSPATHKETIAFFEEHNRFNLSPENLRFFQQGVKPAIDAATGRVLMSAPDSPALSPDGHGGALDALKKSGSLADMRCRGIDHVFYLQVDNPMVRICDPVALGRHLMADSELTSMVIEKANPQDKVGNVLNINGVTKVVEYIEFNQWPEEVIGRRESDGSLRYWAGSIAIHVFDRGFLDHICHREAPLPYHRSLKKVPFIDQAGKTVTPSTENAWKFERFIFDLFPFAKRTLAIEIDPAQQFAPVKNEDGAERDTPSSVREAIVRHHTNVLRNAGIEIDAGVPVELAPKYLLDPMVLKHQLASGTRFSKPVYFNEDGPSYMVEKYVSTAKSK